MRDKILESYPQLSERDVVSTPMGVPGADVQLSEKASTIFPFSVEAKNQEKLNIWSALAEAEGCNRDLTPLLVFKRNNSKTYCCLEIDDFFNLLLREKQNEIDTDRKDTM